MSESVTLKFLRKVGENGDLILQDYNTAITWLNTYRHLVGQPVMVSYYSSFDEAYQKGTKINTITAIGIAENEAGPNCYKIISNGEIETSYYITDTYRDESLLFPPDTSELVNGLWAVCYNDEEIPCYCTYESGKRTFTPIEGDRTFYSAYDGFLWFVSSGVIKRSDSFMGREEIIELIRSMIDGEGEKSSNCKNNFTVLNLNDIGNSIINLNSKVYNRVLLSNPRLVGKKAVVTMISNEVNTYEFYTDASLTGISLYSLDESNKLAEYVGKVSKGDIVYFINKNGTYEVFKLSTNNIESPDNSILINESSLKVRERSRSLGGDKFNSLIKYNKLPIELEVIASNLTGRVLILSDSVKIFGDFDFGEYISKNIFFAKDSNHIYIKGPNAIYTVVTDFGYWDWDLGLSVEDDSAIEVSTDTVDKMISEDTRLITSGGVFAAINDIISDFGKKVDGKDACDTIILGESTAKSENNTIDLTNIAEEVSNKTDVLSEESTNTQYPGAKVVYDSLKDLSENIEENTTKIEELQKIKPVTSIKLDSSTTVIPDESGLADLTNLENTKNKVEILSEDSTHGAYPTAKAVVDYVNSLNNSVTRISVGNSYDDLNKYPYQAAIKVSIPTKTDISIKTSTGNRTDTLYVDKKSDGTYKLTTNIYKDCTLAVEGSNAYICIPTKESSSEETTIFTFVSTNIGSISKVESGKYFSKVILPDFVGEDTIIDDTIFISMSTDDLDLITYSNIIYTGTSQEIRVGNIETGSLPETDKVYSFINSSENTINNLYFHGLNSAGELAYTEVQDFPSGEELAITYTASDNKFVAKLVKPEHYSSDNSVHIKRDPEGKWDFTILNKDIIDYLEDLCSYKPVFKAGTVSGITLNLPTISGTGTAKFTTGNYRGLDNPTYTASNPRPLDFIDSSCEESKCNYGTVTFSQNTNPVRDKVWTASYTLSDLKRNSDSISYKFNFTNANEDTKVMTGTMSVTINKPWFIITTLTTAAPSLDEIEGLINSPSSAIKSKMGNYTEPARSDGYNMDVLIDKAKSYMWIIVPSNKTATFEQKTGSPMESNYITVSNTKYGDYRCYRTTNTQTLGSTVSGFLKIN